MVDDFEYTDSPLNHGWEIYAGTGTVATVADAGRSGRVLRATTDQGTSFGIDHAAGSPSGLLRQLSVWIKASDYFVFCVRVRAANDSYYYLEYVPTDGTPYVDENYATIPVGTLYTDGTWHELTRDMDADLQAAFGVSVSYVDRFFLRGAYDLDDLTLKEAASSPTPTPTATNTPTLTPTPTSAAPNGLVLALGFDENGGTTVADTSGNSNHGAVSNATWTTGRYGSALSFNGTDSWVTVADSNSLDLVGAMTLEAWVFPTDLADWRAVILKETSGDMVYALYASDGAVPGGHALIDSEWQRVDGTTALTLNTWTHLAATFDGAALRLYINGQLNASTSISGNLNTSPWPLRIGGDAVWGEYFEGTIDEVRVYSRALSQSEIQNDMNTPLASRDTGGKSGLAAPVRVSGPRTAPQVSAHAAPPTGQTWRSYYYAGSTRIALRVEGDPDPVKNGVYYLHGDHLGSASLTTDASGNKFSEERYYPYGETRYGSSPTDYQFTGQRKENGLGSLYDFQARHYSPVLGRFLSADTIVPSPGNPQALNRYSYVNNSPLKFVDPSGHCWGFASGLRGTGAYGATCNNIDMALTIVQSPKTSAGQKVGAGAYLAFEGAAHIAVVAGTAVLAGEGIAAASTALSGSAAATGAAGTAGTAAAAASADGDPTNEVQTIGRVFWSGGKVAQQAAGAWAKANNATTLEMTEAGKRLQETTKGLDWFTQARPQWAAASQEFAAGATGEVHVFQNSAGVSLQSIWAKVEYQALMHNQDVTRMIYHVVKPDGSGVIVP